mgnify:CR=1 FL=1
MKRVIITILIFLFGIGCGFGAFFMLKTGGNMKKEELILSGPAPKTGEESRILVFSVLLGMSVTVMGGTIYRIKMKKGANGTL